jgi:RimJ/RimL family protein N-acetyltransferase
MKGDMVELTPIASDEDYALMARWAATSKSTYSQGSPTFATPEQVKAMLTAATMNYLMVRTTAGETIGTVNWRTMAYQDAYTLGVGVGDPALWGGGYGMEAALLLMEHLFHTRNAHRIQVEAGLHNRPMMQLFTSGLIHIEGILRDFYFVDGQHFDCLVGSIMRGEYYTHVAPLGHPRDTVPAAEKSEARRLVNEFLAREPVQLALRPRDAGPAQRSRPAAEALSRRGVTGG